MNKKRCLIKRLLFFIILQLIGLFYNIANFFTEIMAILTIAIACYWTMDFRKVIEPGIYTPMIIMFPSLSALATRSFVEVIVWSGNGSGEDSSFLT